MLRLLLAPGPALPATELLLLTSNAASCRSVSPRGGLTSVSLNQDGSMDGEGEGEGSLPLMSAVLYCCACFVVLQLLHLLLLLCSAGCCCS